jgi:predicted transcriptional regulator
VDNNILFKGKQTGILLALKDSSQAWYVSSLAKAAGTTYVHACNFINVCEEMGIVNCEKHGKLKVVKLTDKGAKITEMLYGITTMISAQNAAQPQAPPAPAQQTAPKEKEQPEKKQP